jgi:hypothetical protein
MAQLKWNNSSLSGAQIISCNSSTGKYVLSVNYDGRINVSNNYGLSWSQPTIVSGSTFISCVCSSTGQIMYISTQNYGIYYSNNYGVSFSLLINQPNGISNSNYYVTCDSTGQKLFAVSNGEGATTTTTYIGIASVSFAGTATWSYPSDPSLNVQFWVGIASDSTGTNLVAIAGKALNYYNSYIYTSINGGVTWNNYGSTGTNLLWQSITSDSTGQYLAAAATTSDSIAGGIYTSKNYGETWTLTSLTNTLQWNFISSDSTGKILLATSFNNDLYLSTNYGVSFELQINAPQNAQWYSCCIGGNSTIGENLYAAINGVGLYYSLNNFIIPPIVCFKEDSKILTKKGYLPIQDLRKGDLIKTIKHGYIPIDMIGYREINNPICEERIKDKLYVCTNKEYPEIFEDLVITGCHSILVENYKDQEQLDKSKEVNGGIYATDDKWRLPACVDERAKPYENEGFHTIYHLALENDDYYMNYGIYANGLVVETCSKRYLKELSNMTLL